MSELTMDRLRENLENLKMKNTLEILDNYLERAVADKLNIVEVLDHIFSEEAKSKRKRAYEKQVQISGFPIKKSLDDFDFSFQPSIDKCQIDELATMRFLENCENVVFLGQPGVGKTHLASALGLVAAQHRFSTYYINCHQLIEQLKKAHFEIWFFKIVSLIFDRVLNLSKSKSFSSNSNPNSLSNSTITLIKSMELNPNLVRSSFSSMAKSTVSSSVVFFLSICNTLFKISILITIFFINYKTLIRAHTELDVYKN